MKKKKKNNDFIEWEKQVPLWKYLPGEKGTDQNRFRRDFYQKHEVDIMCECIEGTFTIIAKKPL